ncbi:YtfJ family protein [Actinobacillus equuli subsp. haemolyticus]|uniref:YtfJ family protein n=1 Tax=Actinobacillus equuli subsp. equuli TaxID=202947 RepID=A0A9X4JF07_ACTEU|nr:YtfJ family protein [Actinobacillus equuli]MDE8035594.1 YtfJ family protein [Actinobacillus equuli subsp. equuli]MDG4949036.1 YtfJ family protein [Actinobacillus equuli subsp. haemolyticus]WGE46882.1 YtfJ family protein [Actinobacillus equuli subsp. haemolyticus]WGE53252.1 YtfJ family protein [Actinobacillus equuli subsp. haemolyticus]WGE59446.1 YtfJ family protein [Actinobacillus equuli subsp. haemolyticus]
MKNSLKLAALSSLLFANVAFAHNVQLNAALPSVTVAKDGELTLNGNKVNYKNWQSSNLNGKVRVIHHFAGRSSVKDKNKALIEAIKAAGFDRAKYQTVTIVNADDAIVGTGVFVKNSVENGKIENPHSQVVLDQNGSVKNTWGLKAKESFIAVLDKTGKVQFVSEGKLSPVQVQQVIDLVKQLTEK